MYRQGLLDRLCQSSVNKNLPSRHVFLQCLCRDLEALLNTRLGWHTWLDSADHFTEGFKELPQSLLSYGLDDFSLLPLSREHAQQQFCFLIARTIAQFEPRLTDIKVSLLPSGDFLQLQLDVMCQVSRVPEPLHFESALDPVNLDFKLYAC